MATSGGGWSGENQTGGGVNELVKPRVNLEVRSSFSVRTVVEQNDMLENI
jgi:hypothetical protein